MRRLSDPAHLIRAYVYLVLGFIVLPIAFIFPMAFNTANYLSFPPSGFTFDWFIRYFNDARWQDATVLSLQIAAITAVISTVIGTMAAYAMVRGSRKIASVFQIIVLGPIIVPHIAFAVSLYLFFYGLGLVGTLPAFVIAHVVLVIPFVIFTIAAALSRIDPELEAAAMSCGASRLSAFRLITLPMILPNVAGSALFAFSLSFDEPVVSFFISGIQQRTLPRRMFDDIEQSLSPIIPAIAVLLTLLSILILVVAYSINRRVKTTDQNSRPGDIR